MPERTLGILVVEDREAVEVEIATGQAHKVEAAAGVEGSLKLYKSSCMYGLLDR